jgi:LemA protein
MELVVFFLIILIIIFIAVFAMYNTLVRLKNQVKNAWAQIDVQLKRRHDLIPNLVETAKGYMQHERQTLENVTKARNMAAGANGIQDKIKAEGGLNTAMGNFMVVVENYPELKANENFLSLQEELTSTENKLSFARQAYNDQVLFYNNKIQMVPTNIIAGMFHFKTREFFELQDESEKKVPKVKF